MKKLFTLFIAASAAIAMQAQTANTRVVELAKQAVVKNFGQQKFGAAQRMTVEDKVGNISIVSAEGAGTVFVGRQNSNLQVLGCSETAYQKGMELPDGLQWWISLANETLSDQMLMETEDGSVEPQDVPSFITTQWGQEKPFYNKCPQVNLRRTVTGCTATAMAQIMNYFKYPAQGHGEARYSIYKVTAGQESVTPKTATLTDYYDWGNMLDSYKTSTKVQDDAVATLMRDCGYASAMEYGREGSAASLWNAARGLADNMDYDSLSLQVHSRILYTDAEWHDMVYTELNAKRPILYAGFDPTGAGGHAFVFDGVRPDGQVHINWGWDGSMDGFYDFTVMHSRANFVESQQMIIGFNPEPSDPEKVPTYTPVVALEYPELEADGTTLYFNGGLFNYDWHFFCGDAVMVLYNATTDEDYWLYFFLEEYEEDDGSVETMIVAPLSGYAFGSDYSNSPLCLNDYFCEEEDPRFTPGDYEVSFIYRANFEEDYRPCRMVAGEEWLATFTVAEDGKITLTEPIGINTITADKKSTHTYNLAGQPINARTRGIVVRDGKKMMQK